MPIKFPIPKPWAIFPKRGKKALIFILQYSVSESHFFYDDDGDDDDDDDDDDDGVALNERRARL